MYADATVLAPYSFRDRMDEAKDAAVHRDRSRPLARVLERRGPLIDYWPVSVVCEVLKGPDGIPLSATRVKTLANQGRFGKCKRSKVGKGRAILIPVHWQSDNSYKLKIERGKRGPVLRSLLLSPGPEEVPF